MSDKGKRAFERVVEEASPRQLAKMRKLLIRGKKGLKSIQANVTTVLRYHPKWRGVLVYDAFAKTVRTTSIPPWDKVDAPNRPEIGEWTDDDTARLVNWLARNAKLFVNTTVAEHGLTVAAHARSVHPLQDYLTGLRWDKRKRLDTFAYEYLGSEDTEYASIVGAKFMIGAIARAMVPGCQVDNTLILESPKQGEKKSSALRALPPVSSWFGDTPIEIGNKDSYQALRGKWIYALDELDSTKRAETTRTKSFLTARTDTYRPSYGRRTVDFLRQTIFCGSTNEEYYLADRTGNRRYWPLPIKNADVEGIERDRDQLWAEAYVRWQMKEPWWDDTPEFKKLCEEEQAERELPDDWQGIIYDWVRAHDKGDGVHTLDVLQNSELQFAPGHVSSGHTQRCAAVLRSLGYKRGALHREGGKLVRRYRLADKKAREEQTAHFVEIPALRKAAAELRQLKKTEKARKSLPGVTDKKGGCVDDAQTSSVVDPPISSATLGNRPRKKKRRTKYAPSDFKLH